MNNNPFERLLSDFRAAWAEMQRGEEMFEIEYVEASTTVLEEYLNRDEREVVCTCNLPVGNDNGVRYVWYVVSLPKKTERLTEYSRRFADLASAAGAALPASVRDAIREYCPWTADHAVSWWFALLYALFEAPYTRAYRPDIWVSRPFLLSVTAIEICRLHTDRPVFPQEPAKTEQSEENDGGGSKPKKPRPSRTSGKKPERGRPVGKMTIQRADFAKPLREQDKTWEEIATLYCKKHSRDIDATADVIRKAVQRQYPEAP